MHRGLRAVGLPALVISPSYVRTSDRLHKVASACSWMSFDPKVSPHAQYVSTCRPPDADTVSCAISKSVFWAWAGLEATAEMAAQMTYKKALADYYHPVSDAPLRRKIDESALRSYFT